MDYASEASEGKNTFGDYLSIITKMIELLSPAGSWTQNACFRGKNGAPAKSSAEAVSRCIYGALIESVQGTPVYDIAFVGELDAWLCIRSPDHHRSIVAFNDQEGRTQAEILDFLYQCKDELESTIYTPEDIAWAEKVLEDA